MTSNLTTHRVIVTDDVIVDGQKFLALVQRIELEGSLLERMAAASHEVFCEGLIARGYRPGPETNEQLKIHRCLGPYAALPEDDKEQNRNNVRDIAEKLARTGYIMVPARSNEPLFDFPGDDLERLAQMEHERWMRSKLDAGWRYAAENDRARKLHRDLVPWDKLPEEEREKDRDMVRGIPKILARAGYALVRPRTVAARVMSC
jgi:hypothetical protein